MTKIVRRKENPQRRFDREATEAILHSFAANLTMLCTCDVDFVQIFAMPNCRTVGLACLEHTPAYVKVYGTLIGKSVLKRPNGQAVQQLIACEKERICSATKGTVVEPIKRGERQKPKQTKGNEDMRDYKGGKEFSSHANRRATEAVKTERRQLRERTAAGEPITGPAVPVTFEAEAGRATGSAAIQPPPPAPMPPVVPPVEPPPAPPEPTNEEPEPGAA